MNNISLSGNLTKEPITARTQSDRLVASGTIAVNRPHSKETDFFDFDLWEQQAEYFSKFAHKGDRIEISGYIINDKYTRKDGTAINKLVVKASTITVFAKSPKNESENFDDLDEAQDDLPF